MTSSTFFARPVLIAGLALAGFCSAGHAATVSLAAQNFSLFTQQAGNGTSGDAASLSFAGFDASLGTLTQVRLIRTDDDRYAMARAQGVILVPETGARFYDNASASFSLNLGAQSLDALNTLAASAMCEEQGAVCPLGFLTASPFEVYDSAAIGITTIDLLGAAMAAFISNSPLSIDFGITLSNAISDDGNVLLNTGFGRSEWLGSLAIEYTYDAVVPPTNGVPEPSALALVGLALAGLALTRRRAG